MFSITKKTQERFIKLVPKFQEIIRSAKDRDVNEADTVSILKDILAEIFGYDKYLEITSEFLIRGTYCDLAIKMNDKVHFLIEAKAVGIELKEQHIKQAVDYGANQGITWIILTNSVEWRLYRIRFEQPINYDLVFKLDFLAVNPSDEKSQSLLFVISKEGLLKDSREEYFEKVQTLNRFIAAQFLFSEPVMTVLKRELKKFSEGVKLENDDVEHLLATEIVKRDLIEGDEAEAAKNKVKKYFRKIELSKQKGAEDEVKPSVVQSLQPLPSAQQSSSASLVDVSTNAPL